MIANAIVKHKFLNGTKCYNMYMYISTIIIPFILPLKIYNLTTKIIY